MSLERKRYPTIYATTLVGIYLHFPGQCLQIVLQWLANDHLLVVLHWLKVLIISLDKSFNLVGNLRLILETLFIKATGEMAKQSKLKGENILAKRKLPILKGMQSDFMAIKLVLAVIIICA